MTPPLPDAALLDEIEQRPMEPGKAPVISRDEIKQLIAAARAGLRVPALEEALREIKIEYRKHGAAGLDVMYSIADAALNPKDPK